MARLAVILPHENLAVPVNTLLRLMHMEQSIVLHYSGDNTEIPSLVERARRQGADLILTRGLIAARVRQCSDIPVVEMRITAQELGLLIQKAKVLTLNTPPTIAIVGLANTFCDYSRLGELFDVALTSYLIQPDDPDPYTSLASQTEQAVADHVDVIIGGETACSIARDHNVPSIFLASTTDSIQESLWVARRIIYAIELEKNNAAELQTMLDSSFSVLIRFDRDGYITNVNRAAVTRLNWKTYHVYGKPVLSLLKGISQQQLQQVLFTGKTLQSVFITIGEERFVANLMPVRTAEGVIIGGVLSCDDVQRIETVSVDIRREQRRMRHSAAHSFSDFPQKDLAAKRFVETASRFAQSEFPILIQSEAGCYPEILAECLHNASDRREMPFVTVNCAELRPEEQLDLLFGISHSKEDLARSICALAHMGTLYLQAPEALCPQAQSRLWSLLTQKSLLAHTSPFPLDVAVITSTHLDNWGQFDSELQFLLCSLTLRLPPLRERPDELQKTWEQYLQIYLDKYQRHLSVTAGGTGWVLAQDWPGNYLQLDRFCERLVLSAPRRSVDESTLSMLFQEMLPAFGPVPRQTEMASSYVPPEAVKIKEALTRNLGSRSATARELGISTSTLWRKINKYNLK